MVDVFERKRFGKLNIEPLRFHTRFFERSLDIFGNIGLIEINSRKVYRNRYRRITLILPFLVLAAGGVKNEAAYLRDEH